MMILFGVLPTPHDLQKPKNVFALMQTVYDILSNIVRIQANDIYEKSNRLAHFRDFKFYISDDSKLKRYEAIWKKIEDVVMLRDSSTMPQRTHHIQNEITDTSSSFHGFYAQQHILASQIKKESVTHNLKQQPVYVPRVNKIFIEWVTDYDCLIKNDDFFGVLPTPHDLQKSKNVFALMQKIYDILLNIVRIQANDIYKKSHRLAHFQQFKFYISHDTKLKRYEAIWKKFEDVVMLRDSSTMHHRTHDIQHQITQNLGSIKGLL